MIAANLSLPVLFDDDERDYDTPCYLVNIQARFASRVSDDIDTRAEAKALQEHLREALAKQAQPCRHELTNGCTSCDLAQPLTDEMIETEAWVSASVGEEQGFIEGASGLATKQRKRGFEDMIRIDKSVYGRPEDREALENMLRASYAKRIECEDCGRRRVNHKCPGADGEACSRSLCSECGSEEHSL